MSAAIDDSPIFIGGIAGTGKTRLGSLLGNHPDLAVTRKTYLWRDHYGRFGDLSETRNSERCLRAVLASPGVQRLQIDREAIRSDFGELPQTYEDLFALVHRSHARAMGKPRWCDQLGLVEAFAEPIFAAYPTAKMVHMVRDPRCNRLADRGAGAFGWTLGKWLTSVALAEKNMIEFPGRYLVVRQEDFETDEEATLRIVCSFIGSAFEPSMLRDPTATGPQLTNRRASNRRFAEVCARDLMASQGYRVEVPQPTKSMRYHLVDRPASTLGVAAWQRMKLPALRKQVGCNA